MENEITHTNVLALPFADTATRWQKLRQSFRLHLWANFLIITLSIILAVLVLFFKDLSNRPVYEAHSIIHVDPIVPPQNEALKQALTRPDVVMSLLNHPETRQILTDEDRFYPGHPLSLTAKTIRQGLILLKGDRPGEMILSYRSPNPFLASYIVTQLPLILEQMSENKLHLPGLSPVTKGDRSSPHGELVQPVTYAHPKLYRMLLNSLDEPPVSLAASIIPISFVARAAVPQTPLPSIRKDQLVYSGLMGLSLGLILSWFASLALSRTDILTTKIEKLSGLPVLGIIPAPPEK